MKLTTFFAFKAAILSAAADMETRLYSSHPSPHGLVDLGYAKHVPTYTNTTESGHRVHIYENIRFANPPTGNLRFRRPDTNLPHEPGIQDGKVPWASTDCIASAPPEVPFPGMSGTTWGHEDCLFLDVYVPEGVQPGDDVPVFHWFFGSGYAFSSKNLLFSPMGLFDHMFEQHAGKFIFVVNNYRLGVPGWTYSSHEDMDSNVGLFDCLAAAEWTSKFIHKFGGDAKRITAGGESAGAGMLYYMSVLFGGKGKLPFQQIFISSPCAAPRRNVAKRQTELYKTVLDAANCTTLECLRCMPEEKMIAVNKYLINDLPAGGGGGTFGPVLGFGPAPDGESIPDIPLALLKEGHYHGEVKRLLLGGMAEEGNGTADDVNMPARFPQLVRKVMPTASNDTIAYIESQYDPLVPAQLAWDWTTDAIFSCNSYNLAKVMPQKTKRYIMSAPPAIHGMDMLYYFYVNQELTPIGDPATARELQTKVLQFVHGKDIEEMQWPTYGAKERLVNVTATALVPTRLGTDFQRRCDVISRLALDPANGV